MLRKALMQYLAEMQRQGVSRVECWRRITDAGGPSPGTLRGYIRPREAPAVGYMTELGPSAEQRLVYALTNLGAYKGEKEKVDVGR